MNKIKRQKGFTLIELLVVIAIIGILAAIVLVNVNSARNKAKDAAIKANFATIPSAAENIYDSDNSYDAVFDTTVVPTTEPLKALAAVVAISSLAVGNDDPNGWCACAPLISPTTATYYCIDSAGSKVSSTTVDCDTACTALDVTCE